MEASSNELLNEEMCANMSTESLEALVEMRKENMRRKEILSKYNIHQLPNGDWYTRIEGKKRQFRKMQFLLELLCYLILALG